MDTAPPNAAPLRPVAPAPDSESELEPEPIVLDQALAPFADFISGLAAVAEPLADEQTGLLLTLQSLRLDLPFEMDARSNESGRVTLAGGPPTLYTETSFNSVTHQLRLSVEVDGGPILLANMPDAALSTSAFPFTGHAPDSQR